MKRIAALSVVGLVLLVIVAGSGAGRSPPPAAISSSAPVEDVAISTEYAFEFQPPVVTVTAGDTIDLVVTQADDIPHTFTLSSVVNYTIPSTDSTSQLYDFFNAHPPLVNLSLPATVGAQAFDNFTAPPVGTYEFVCEIPGHFTEGMYGFLTSSSQTHPSNGGSTTSFPLSELELGAIGGVVVILVVGVAIAWRRSRSKPARQPPDQVNEETPPSAP